MTSGVQPRTGLILQGGGARGAYQVGALKAIAEITGARENPFPIVCGCSVGAINAAALASHASNFPDAVVRLERLWRQLSCSSIYQTDLRSLLGAAWRWISTLALCGLGKGDPGPLLNNQPLSRLLEREYDRAGLCDALEGGALDALCISTSNYADGVSVSFFESAVRREGWGRARRIGRPARIEVAHLMASSALPFVFSPVRLDGAYHGDGALRLTTPFSPAIRLGAERIVVIGGRDNMPQPDVEARPCAPPTLGEVAGHALDILFNDDLEADHERLCRINETFRLLPDTAAEHTALRTVETCMLQPSLDLRRVAAEHRHQLPRNVRTLLRSVGAWGENGRLISYLLFEPAYIDALIELGYSDTMARAGEVQEFFAV